MSKENNQVKRGFKQLFHLVKVNDSARWLMGILAIAFLFLYPRACGAPITSQDDAPHLITTYDLDELQELISKKQNITIGFPNGWEKHDGSFITLASGNLLDARLSRKEPDYSIYTTRPSTGISSWTRRIPRSAHAYASENTRISNLPKLEPIRSVDVNGHDGAILIEGDETMIRYTVVVRVSEDLMANIYGYGPRDKLGEMRDAVNAIALSTKPIE